MTCLPVEINVACHRTLDNEIAEIQIAEVVTTVAQGERLELCDARFLVGEELIRITLLVRIEAFVGIKYHRL